MALNTESVVADFNLLTGLSKSKESTKRNLSRMKGMFHDDLSFDELVNSESDPLVYEFYELDIPQTAGDILFGTSIVYPGKVGGEYFMTKGHFHTILETGEVYYCLSGDGYMLMENPEGDWKIEKFEPGQAVYVPPRYAHRSINIGEQPLVTFFAFRADAGHDYGTIETKGYRKLVIEKDGKPEVIDNPKWK
ncbi:glucose-6-phosphate isomerase [Cytobacillus purgationiresistens]|uniref:glucose-6-phosphate isomerase n=1 Tax=Cytobacillus purgationiresistens TaxID=863449 RepID=A0ABU0AIB9_9BACI|nr:glucose-6-phosphate isomerase [Cytobacillus purgationiresistens]MDQ0271002.1 glucose-6-phosphate isomerase [Cytobacillus purgationiresistens]